MQTMPQEKLNNLLQQKLEQLKAVPEGVDFNPSSAWQKMEERLHSKNKTYKSNRYVVAASVVLILFCVWVIKDDDKAVHEKITSHKVTSHKIQKALSTALIKKELVPEASPRCKPLNVTTINKIEHTKDKRREYVIATIENDREKSNTPAVPTLQEHIPLLIQSETAVITPPVKKIRIVHINEIEQSIETAKRNTTAYTGFKFFKHTNQTAIDSEEPTQVEEAQPSRKDRGFIKAIIHTFKED